MEPMKAVALGDERIVRWFLLMLKYDHPAELMIVRKRVLKDT